MSAGFCLHCGLRVEETAAESFKPLSGLPLHAHCVAAHESETLAQMAARKTPMQQQLDRIEGLLMAIRDRYSL